MDIDTHTNTIDMDTTGYYEWSSEDDDDEQRYPIPAKPSLQFSQQQALRGLEKRIGEFRDNVTIEIADMKPNDDVLSILSKVSCGFIEEMRVMAAEERRDEMLRKYGNGFFAMLKDLQIMCGKILFKPPIFDWAKHDRALAQVEEEKSKKRKRADEKRKRADEKCKRADEKRKRRTVTFSKIVQVAQITPLCVKVKPLPSIGLKTNECITIY